MGLSYIVFVPWNKKEGLSYIDSVPDRLTWLRDEKNMQGLQSALPNMVSQ